MLPKTARPGTLYEDPLPVQPDLVLAVLPEIVQDNAVASKTASHRNVGFT